MIGSHADRPPIAARSSVLTKISGPHVCRGVGTTHCYMNRAFKDDYRSIPDPVNAHMSRVCSARATTFVRNPERRLAGPLIPDHR